MNKKFKKVVALVFIMTSLLTLFGPAALASEITDEGFINKIDQVNDYIYREIDKAVKKAEEEAQKNQSEQKLNETIDKIIEELIEKTNGKVEKLIDKAAEEGIVLEKSYIEVQIHDRIIYVDPFYAH